MSGRTKFWSAFTICGLGVAALSVPSYDVLTDVSVRGESVASALVENSPLLVLGVAIVGIGVWVGRSDWEDTYVRTVAKIALLNTAGVAVLMGIVVLVQSELQSEFRPLIIAADGIVIGILAGTMLGIQTAQQKSARDDAAAQRDRFQALFDSVPNPVVGVEFVDGAPVVRAANPAFAEVFGVDPEAAAGDELEEYVVPPEKDLDPVDRQVLQQPPEDREEWDSDIVELETDEGRREFIRLTAPVGQSPKQDGYGIYVDVTDQRQRQERLRVLSRTLRHDIRNKLSVVMGLRSVADELDGSDREIVEMAVDAAENLSATADRVRSIEDQIAGENPARPRNLATLVADAAAAVDDEYEDATVTVEAPDRVFGTVTASFSTAVESVVRNGIEHNDSANPTVEVTVTESLDGEYVDVSVADDGPGIEPYQVDIAEGTVEPDQKTMHLDGLGLWTARWAIQNSGGSLEFDSGGSRGTVVTLRVPAVNDATA